MSDHGCKCCDYVLFELEKFKRQADTLEKNLAVVTGDRDWYEREWKERGAQGERMARRIRSFEGAAIRRKNAAKAARLAAKGKP